MKNTKQKKNPVGRPSDYTMEKADQICEQLALGYSLRTVCKRDDFPSVATVFKWMRENEVFLKQYARAKEESADALFEETIDIADDSTNDFMEREVADGKVVLVTNQENIQRSRLRVDTRKWMMSKMKPKKYGEKIDMTTAGEKIESGFIILPPKKDENSMETTTETEQSS